MFIDIGDRTINAGQIVSPGRVTTDKRGRQVMPILTTAGEIVVNFESVQEAERERNKLLAILRSVGGGNVPSDAAQAAPKRDKKPAGGSAGSPSEEAPAEETHSDSTGG